MEDFGYRVKRYNNIDLFRVICIWGVLFLHSYRENALRAALGEWGNLCVSCFVMMSGALILQKGSKENYWQWIHKTWKKLIVPWILAYLLYLVEGLAFSYIQNGTMYFKTEIESFVRYGYPVRGWHLWFMPMFILIYLLVPLMRYAKQYMKAWFYVLIIPFYCLSKMNLDDGKWMFVGIKFIWLFLLGGFVFSYVDKLKKYQCRCISVIGIVLLGVKMLGVTYHYYGLAFPIDYTLIPNELILICSMVLFSNLEISFDLYWATKYFMIIYIMHIFVGDFWSGVEGKIGFGESTAWYFTIFDTIVIGGVSVLFGIMFDRLKRLDISVKC